MARPAGGAPGGSFLFRRLRDVTRVLRLRAVVPVSAGNVAVWVDLTDQRMLAVLDEIRWELKELRVLRALLTPGSTFVDAGANHGSFAIRAARLVGRVGLVVAVEPNPRLASLVRRSLESTDVPQRVHAVALGDVAGTATLHIPRDASGSASLLEGYAPGRMRTVTVPMVLADTVLAGVPSDRPCVLKLDVEGAEAAVLRGAKEFLGRVRPVVLWEINSTSAEAAGGLDAVFDAFAAAGYERFAELDAWPETIPATAVARTPQRNLLAVPA